MTKVSDIMKIILVVDENQGALSVLRDLLEEPKRIVITQQSGLEALRLIRLGMHVDAVVASDGLRDIETFQLFIALKRLAPAVPFIVMLTPGHDAECLKGLSPGIFEYVEKPVKAADLKRMVDAVLEWASDRQAPDYCDGRGIPRIGTISRKSRQMERNTHDKSVGS